MSIEDRTSELSERLATLEQHVVGIMTVEQLAQLWDKHLVAVAIQAHTGFPVRVRLMPDGSFEVSHSYSGAPLPAETRALIDKLHSLGMAITAREE